MALEGQENLIWLTTDAAAKHLTEAASMLENKVNPLKIARTLRTSLTSSKAAVVMEQAQLRSRARRKFVHADRMFFTGKSLEQATSANIAAYKADRFRNCDRVVDVCCGIGGDVIALAKRRTNVVTVGVDRDPVACCFAKANLEANSCSAAAKIECSDFQSFNTTSFDSIHIDPDRRVNGRTVAGCRFEPSLGEIFQRVASDQLLAIKTAPATVVEDTSAPVVREWIGTWRECKEQILWLNQGDQASTKRATVVSKDGQRFHYQSACEQNSLSPQFADEFGDYIYEPHATVLAAGLAESLAVEHGLKQVAQGVAYLTSNQAMVGLDPILKGYRIEKVLPADIKRIHHELKSENVGQLVVKKRGVDQVLADRVSRLKLGGDSKATLILTRINRSRRALLVSRLS